MGSETVRGAAVRGWVTDHPERAVCATCAGSAEQAVSLVGAQTAEPILDEVAFELEVDVLCDLCGRVIVGRS